MSQRENGDKGGPDVEHKKTMESHRTANHKSGLEGEQSARRKKKDEKVGGEMEKPVHR